ncbi:4Fe-4S binding protein [Adlercreutzia sp. ZJ242]|uniref:4Fe-4S binding protein n=1 Tax=Adlercreutzia sp. ZJ242 TaxID=2709409 RepID=UPI0013ED354E|nr:4Fe-4S binding protein [Adlercreutzia sp. ZJ242]
MAEFFAPSNRYDVAAYFLAQAFNLDEFAMARALPGTPAEVAEKTGFDEGFIKETLERLVGQGKITKTPQMYVKLTPVSAIYWDYIIFAIDNNDIAIEGETEKLVKLCRSLAKDPDMYTPDKPMVQFPMRCIPKGKAIKGVPGAMDCESLEFMVREAFAKGELSIERCWCRVGVATWTEGEYNEETAKKTTPSGIYEGRRPVDGHCLVLGKTAKHWRDTINAPTPTEEDVERVLADIESRNVILIGSNSRLGGNICACDFATCYPNGRFQAWANKPSRFKPVTDADKCAKCAKCAELCQLGAIFMDEDGLPQVDPEKCLGCGNCVVFCESEAKEMELVHPVEWIPDGDVHLFTPMAPR